MTVEVGFGPTMAVFSFCVKVSLGAFLVIRLVKNARHAP